MQNDYYNVKFIRIRRASDILKECRVALALGTVKRESYIAALHKQFNPRHNKTIPELSHPDRSSIENSIYQTKYLILYVYTPSDYPVDVSSFAVRMFLEM